MNIICFFLERKVNFGQAVYFLSNIQGWRLDSAVKMTCVKVNQWACRVSILQSEIQYKYFISSFDRIDEVEWEDGDNRHLKLDYMPKRINDRWNQRRVIFIIIGDVRLIFLQSNTQNLLVPKKMKKYNNGSIRLFYKAIYLTLNEINKTIYIHCYLISHHQCVQMKMASTKFNYTFEKIHQVDIDQLEVSETQNFTETLL